MDAGLAEAAIAAVLGGGLVTGYTQFKRTPSDIAKTNNEMAVANAEQARLNSESVQKDLMELRTLMRDSEARHIEQMKLVAEKAAEELLQALKARDSAMTQVVDLQRRLDEAEAKIKILMAERSTNGGLESHLEDVAPE